MCSCVWLLGGAEEEGEDMAYDSGSDNGKGMANNKRIKRACSYCHTKKGTPMHQE